MMSGYFCVSTQFHCDVDLSWGESRHYMKMICMFDFHAFMYQTCMFSCIFSIATHCIFTGKTQCLFLGYQVLSTADLLSFHLYFPYAGRADTILLSVSIEQLLTQYRSVL